MSTHDASNEVFVFTSPLDLRARPLLDDLAHEYNLRYSAYYRREVGQDEINRYSPESFQPPDGAFLLLLRDGEAIAGGAFMRHGPDTAEFKRMWTRSDLRRQGLARRVLVELEAQARRQDYSRIFLTTGFRQPEAVGLYLSTGYTPLFDLIADPEKYQKLPFEKWLVRRDHSATEAVATPNKHGEAGAV